MSTMSHRRRLAAFTVGLAVAAPAAALGDPPKDSVPSPAGHAPQLFKNYEMNSASGDYAPARTESMGVAPIHTQIGPVGHTPAPTSQQADDGFALGDAATGAAAIALLLSGVALVVRTTGRPRHSPTGIGS
jgi:hypothetical protein